MILNLKDIYKKKGWFCGNFTLEGSIAYMLHSGNFSIELTAKYKKTYNGEYGRVYEDVLKENIKNKKYKNLQIYYCGREGGKHKGIKLLKKYFEMKKKYTDEELGEIYIKHYNVKYNK